MKIQRTPRILANYPLPAPALERPPPLRAAWPRGTKPAAPAPQRSFPGSLPGPPPLRRPPQPGRRPRRPAALRTPES